MRKPIAASIDRAARTLALALALGIAACSHTSDGGTSTTSSNVKHVVVVIQENTSFDAYLAT